MYIFSMIFQCGPLFSSPQQRENPQIADLQLCTFKCRIFFVRHAVSGAIQLCIAFQLPMGWWTSATSHQMGRVLSTQVFYKWVRWDDHVGGWKPAVHFGPRINLLWNYTIGIVDKYPSTRWVAQLKLHHPILSSASLWRSKPQKMRIEDGSAAGKMRQWMPCHANIFWGCRVHWRVFIRCRAFRMLPDLLFVFLLQSRCQWFWRLH